MLEPSRYKVLKNVLIIVLWPILGLLLASTCIVAADSFFDDGHISSLESLAISQLGFAFVTAGFLAIYANFKIKKISAFLMMAMPSLLLMLSGLPFSSIVASVLPLLLWQWVKQKERDEFVMLRGLFKTGLFKRRDVRVSISLYAAWLCFLIPNYDFDYGYFLGNYEYDFIFFMIVPPMLAVGAYFLFQWCRRGI